MEGFSSYKIRSGTRSNLCYHTDTVTHAHHQLRRVNGTQHALRYQAQRLRVAVVAAARRHTMARKKEKGEQHNWECSFIPSGRHSGVKNTVLVLFPKQLPR
jgi:hypothetical protein